MFFRQGLALLMIALMAQTVDAHDQQHHAHDRKLNKFHGAFRRTRHYEATAHDYHTRYFLGNEKPSQDFIPVGGKADQELQVGSKGAFEQNVHLPEGVARDVTIHYEKGTLDVIVKESNPSSSSSSSSSSRGQTRRHSSNHHHKRQHHSDDRKQRRHHPHPPHHSRHHRPTHAPDFVGEAQEEFLQAAHATQLKKESDKPKLTTEQNIGFAVLAGVTVVALFTLIASVVSMFSSNNNGDNTEAVAPQIDEAGESTDSESEIDSSDSSEAQEGEGTNEDEAGAKEPVVRDEAIESIEASV